MAELDDTIARLVKDTTSEIMPQKDLLIEAFHELVKDEIKRYIRQKIDQDPELKNEIKEAVTLYLSAKLKEIHATIKLAKAGTKLGLNLIPDQMKDEMSKELVSLFEKEITEMMDRA
jgi:hypothetical protein